MKVLSGGDPVSIGDIDGGIGEFIDSNLGGGVGDDAGEGLEGFCNNGDGLFGVIGVTYADGGLDNSLSFGIPKNFADDMAIGDGDFDAILVYQGCTGELYLLHDATNIFDTDGISNNEGFSENDGNTCAVIRQRALDCISCTKDEGADGGDEWCDGYAELAEGEYKSKADYKSLDERGEEAGEGNIELLFAAKLCNKGSDPSGDIKADEEDDYRADDLEAVVDKKFDYGIDEFLQGRDLTFHDYGLSYWFWY